MSVTIDTTVAARLGPIDAEKTRSTAKSSVDAASSFPRWLRSVDAVHAHGNSWIAVGVEWLFFAGGGALVGLSLPVAGAIAAGLSVGLYLSGRYRRRTPVETQGVWAASQTITAIGIAMLMGVIAAHLAGWDVGAVLRFGAAAMAGSLALQLTTWAILAVARRRGAGLHRTLIIGDEDLTSMLAKKLAEHPQAGLLPVAILSDCQDEPIARGARFPDRVELETAIDEARAEHVILAPRGNDPAVIECLTGATGSKATFSMLPPIIEFFLHPGHVSQVGGLPLIPLANVVQAETRMPGKRLLDLLIASALLAFFSPIMLTVAIAIRLVDGGPILYRQERVGRDGGMFKMLKFRSMVVDAERLVVDLREKNMNNGLLFKIHDDPRISRVGRIIRRMSIDELPQLWNVIRGDMSLVGPRPLPVRPEDFNAMDNRRHAAPPGITGYWQTAGDHSLSYEEMVRLDLAYIANWSLWLDMRLLLRTIPAIMNRRGPS